MPTNDFLTVANDPGSHVESQVDYAASTKRALGYNDGDSPPADEFNKMLRQSSAITALLAAWLVNQTGNDLLDDGDQAAKLETFGLAARIKLIANTTFYVRADGSNANNGLTNNAGGAWLTKQYAIDFIYANYDAAGFNITIQVADGADSTGAANFYGLVLGQKTPILLQGNLVTPSNVLINTAGAIGGVSSDGARVQLKGFKVSAAGGNAYGLTAGNGGSIGFDAIEFGACAQAHIQVGQSGYIACGGAYTISGGSVYHVYLIGAGAQCSLQGATITTAGTPAFSGAFIEADITGVLIAPTVTFAGTGATGKRYNVTTNAVVQTNAGGANYFPGNAAGTTATGGQYV